MTRRPKFAPTKIKLSQIKVAQEIQKELRMWDLTDKALRKLNECYEGFSLGACMVKAAAVNSLYSTYVLAITQMAEHIHAVLQLEEFGSITESNSAELVERIAALKLSSARADQGLDPDMAAPKRHKQRQFRSFASKFCAFFVNPDLFPIYDEAAREAIKHHLPPEDVDQLLTYSAFMKNVRALCEWSNLQVGYKEIDRYLWLRGMYDRHAKRDPRVNSELRKFFERKPPELSVLLGDP
jgi:hypothetical protein